MLSYSYTLHKLCRLLGYDELSQKFNVLKSQDKLRAQDMLWEAVCKELGFEFEPSLK